jgi:hypothetical protein
MYCSNGCQLTWNMIASNPNSVSGHIFVGSHTHIRTIKRNNGLSKFLNHLLFLMLSISVQEISKSSNWFKLHHRGLFQPF